MQYKVYVYKFDAITFKSIIHNFNLLVNYTIIL